MRYLIRVRRRLVGWVNRKSGSQWFDAAGPLERRGRRAPFAATPFANHRLARIAARTLDVASLPPQRDTDWIEYGAPMVEVVPESRWPKYLGRVGLAPKPRVCAP